EVIGHLLPEGGVVDVARRRIGLGVCLFHCIEPATGRERTALAPAVAVVEDAVDEVRFVGHKSSSASQEGHRSKYPDFRIARSSRRLSSRLSTHPVTPNTDTPPRSGGTWWLQSSDEPRNNALVIMPHTSRLTDGS